MRIGKGNEGKTSPEELLAAAHAACFATSLAGELTRAGSPPEKLNVTANIVEPGVLYGDRINEIDVRFGKIFKVGRTRTTVGVDIYNLLNTDAILSYNQAFITGGSWLTPTSEMSARFAKLSLQFEF